MEKKELTPKLKDLPRFRTVKQIESEFKSSYGKLVAGSVTHITDLLHKMNKKDAAVFESSRDI